jgi:Putative zinc-finger
MLISCKDASRLISQLQEGGLPTGRRIALRLHLLFCDACTNFRRQLILLREAMQRYRD